MLISEDDSNDMVLPDIRDRLKGRVLLGPIPGFEWIEVGEEWTDAMVDQIVNAGTKAVRVRSVLGCLAHRGVCRKCYERDLPANAFAGLGEAAWFIFYLGLVGAGMQISLPIFLTGGIAKG